MPFLKMVPVARTERNATQASVTLNRTATGTVPLSKAPWVDLIFYERAVAFCQALATSETPARSMSVTTTHSHGTGYMMDRTCGAYMRPGNQWSNLGYEMWAHSYNVSMIYANPTAPVPFSTTFAASLTAQTTTPQATLTAAIVPHVEIWTLRAYIEH